MHEAEYNKLTLGTHNAPAAGNDDASWRVDRRKAHLWVVVAAATTALTIAAKPADAVALALLGSEPDAVLASDRHSSFE